MPIYQFQCLNGHEFEKFVEIPSERMQWCKHCDRLTTWTEIRDPHSIYYKAKVCSECLGNEYHAPLLSPESPAIKKEIQAECPECHGVAEHVLRIETNHGGHSTPGVQSSSVRFHFNYLEPMES